jgi:hypothetical protein
MIAEYKLYHGAALAELICELSSSVSIDELKETGRLSSYVLNHRVGLQIKHSTQRLTPWNFTFTRYNMSELLALRARFDDVFVIFVCETQGMVCVSIEELLTISEVGQSDQVWFRVERRRGKWFQVHGSKGLLAAKKPNGLDQLVFNLEPGREQAPLMQKQN